jgi:hypothetical protein
VAGAEALGGEGVSLLPHERIAARLTANHIQDGRAYEGYLYVTSQRIVHVPWPASEARGARPFDIPLTEVAKADAAPRGTNWRDGSWRRRLRVTVTSRDTELFVVWRVGRAVELVERMRREAASAG